MSTVVDIRRLKVNIMVRTIVRTLHWVRFEIVTVLNITTVVFRDVILFTVGDKYLRFRGTCSLHLQDRGSCRQHVLTFSGIGHCAEVAIYKMHILRNLCVSFKSFMLCIWENRRKIILPASSGIFILRCVVSYYIVVLFSYLSSRSLSRRNEHENCWHARCWCHMKGRLCNCLCSASACLCNPFGIPLNTIQNLFFALHIFICRWVDTGPLLLACLSMWLDSHC
jgi:hypothetical protein